MNNVEKRLQDPFPEADIEWRIGQAGTTHDGKVWAKCLAYVTARAVQDRLDEVFGTLGWRVRFDISPTTQNVLCTIGVLDQNGNWVEKQDGSEPTDFEAFKGGLSGAFKRAAVHFGIGRYLYHLDVGWAEIVGKGVPGAKYQPENDKKKMPGFYWLPPKLPASALPATSAKESSIGATNGPRSDEKARLVADIMAAAEERGMSLEKLAAINKEMFGKPASELNADQLRALLVRVETTKV